MNRPYNATLTLASERRTRNLHDETDGFRMPKGFDALRRVQSLGTTAPALKSLGNIGPTREEDLDWSREAVDQREAGRFSEWQADLEYVWRKRVAAPIALLLEREKKRRRQAASLARAAELAGNPSDGAWYRVACMRSAEWAADHARALAMSRQDVVATCGERWRRTACGCTTVEFRVGCDQPQLCGKCRRKHWRKWSRRITLSMDYALREARERWHRSPNRRGMRPGIYLITLTAPHTGDLATDRERMGVAVRKLLKHANKYEWWSTYALTWEATSGRDGLGHMHVHLAVISSWIPYRRAEVVAATDEQALQRWDGESPAARPRSPKMTRRRWSSERGLHDVWRDAMPGALVLDVKAPITVGDAARIGAEYLAKYVTKGVDPAEFTGRKAGELLIAFRARRKVSTSAGFWERIPPECECCGELWRSLGAPQSLQQIAPGAVLRSMSERLGSHVPRGEVQVGLRWGPG